MRHDTSRLTSLLTEAVSYGHRHVRSGGLPFVGVVVTGDGHVSGYGVNRVRETGDPTAHAEIVAMRAVLDERGPESLQGATLLATGEPCAVCYRFAAGYGIARVLFAVDRDTAAAWGFDYRDGYAALGTDQLPLAQAAQHRTVAQGLDPFTTYAAMR